jgi:hypothetical protein
LVYPSSGFESLDGWLLIGYLVVIKSFNWHLKALIEDGKHYMSQNYYNVFVGKYEELLKVSFSTSFEDLIK